MSSDLPLAAVLPSRLRFRPLSGPPGAHPARGEWTEGEFLRHVPLHGQFDPRRIDLLASLRDPFGGLHLRTFAPRRAVPVVVLADVSGSMSFAGTGKGLSRLADFARAIAAGAQVSGDHFGLIGADTKVREDLFLPPTRRQGLADEILHRLEQSAAAGNSARGLIAAAERLPRRRSLVFLVSDFLMPDADLREILEPLWRHDVAPVVVRDKVMDGDLPAFGFVALRDLETGRGRLMFMRPSLRVAWRQAAQDRLANLERIFAEHGRRSFHLLGRLDVDALTEFLLDA
jgi:uncharacterized protein (DUF58 family)